MPCFSVETLSLALSFVIAALVCCMLVALRRLSARLPPVKASSTLPPAQYAARPRQFSPFGYLATQPHSINSTMFTGALKTYQAISSSQKKAPVQQQSLNKAFKAQIPATRPLSTGTANITKQNPAAGRRPAGIAHGTKRTSSGLAKALGSQDDSFDYPTLNISDDDEAFSYLNTTNNTIAQTPVYFDENDFDSDIDLEVEDPASKGTVHYPTLPPQPRAALDSSQPIPWSSSPVEHFKTPQKPALPPPSKRRTLPWLQTGGVETDSIELEPEVESEPEESRPKKRISTQADKPANSTPAPKETVKPVYQWNTTASAVKQQQRNLREANKMMKANDVTDEDVKRAITKKKKNTIHRIFLSEEQQHVLNLCVEYKKSVFFTGSAGESAYTSYHIRRE
ncbi:hypothetical protein K504DRAFT_251680 [Pleomassaria siparia CBS 279.74]|uniref:Uncharacterized protein n=1 Tax=Pleomassaria siparia CBS 279.74 TaxID=1314801 RepID=A0A6G1KBU7_9PLEO|nr:hypothetical protein K504DRAFT_251680 [Pleomassaria siparia CBS 279.74]